MARPSSVTRTSGAAVAQLVAAPEARAADPTPYPGGRYSPPEATCGTHVDQGLTVRMSDGLVLTADVTYPTDPSTGQRAEGTFPVILTQEAYRGSLTGLTRGVPGATPPTPEYFVDSAGTSP